MDKLNRGDIEKLKDYTGIANKNVEKLRKFTENARKLEKEGKALNILQDVAKDLQGLAQLGTVLGGFAAGLSLVLAFIPKKDIEHEILDGIKEIQAKVDGLKQMLKTGIDEIKLEEQIEAQTAALLDQIATIESAHAILRQLAEYRVAGKDTSHLISHLMEFKQKELQQAVEKIRIVITGTELKPKGLLDAIYEETYGNTATVAMVSQYLMAQMHTAVMIYGVLTYEQARLEAGGPPSADKIKEYAEADADLLEPNVSAAAEHAWKVMERCLDAKTAHANVARYFSKHESDMTISHEDYRKSALSIAETMQAHYEYLKFSVAVYIPLLGRERHYHFWSSDNTVIFQKRRLDQTKKKKINLLIFWAGRKSAESPVVYDKHELVPYRPDGPRVPRKFESGTVLEDIFGGPHKPASPDPDLASLRVDRVLMVSWWANRNTKYGQNLSYEPSGIDYRVSRWIHLLSEGGPYLISLFFCKHDEFGFASSNAGCVVHDGKQLMPSEDTSPFEGVKSDPEFGDYKEPWARLGVFWGDR